MDLQPHPHSCTCGSQPRAYLLKDIPSVVPVSLNTVQRAIHTTKPDAFPPPLRAKRVGHGLTAKYMVLSADIDDWLERFPDG